MQVPRDQARREGDGEILGHERADRQHVARDEGDVGLEARGDACVAHDPAGRGRDPRVLRQLAQAHGAPSCQTVPGPHGDHEGLVEQLMTAQPRMLARRRGRVLEEHGDVQAPIGDARGELLDRPLDSLHALGHHGGDRRRHQRGQRAGKASDAQRAAIVAELGELDVGQGEALRHRLRVIERDRARLGQGQAPGPAMQQPRPQLALERGHLLRDRRLRQRQLARGGRERAGLRDGTEGEQPPRIQHKRRLCHGRFHDLN